MKYSVMRYYSFASLEEKLDRAGFEVEEHKYFFNSPISSFLLCRYIKGKALPFQLLFPFVHALSILSDRCLGRRSEGYFLAAKPEENDRTLRYCREPGKLACLDSWEFKKCLRLSLAILLVAVGLVRLAAIGFDIPILKTIVGFILLTFILGIFHPPNPPNPQHKVQWRA